MLAPMCMDEIDHMPEAQAVDQIAERAAEDQRHAQASAPSRADRCAAATAPAPR